MFEHVQVCATFNLHRQLAVDEGKQQLVHSSKIKGGVKRKFCELLGMNEYTLYWYRGLGNLTGRTQ